ncbi:PREDICTED: survival of motor neuron-related-splicing factor 30 isoform X1 [Acromyrmex echinatior]|uniref:Survival of motor neuron-related-splicing factor 30 n=1 Tax=Atta cephalotes TaxID=12957 RepID=A0A158N9Y6_ATTCE|nr:PREDICTED: survival of motor neuron-related-splicing factor 30 isoform X1 [Acromyrmex echinatior]XP_012054344.1 PREDICTED: survival of motor neuron-related-splicing factor 30 [Atta cephalotes]
MDDLQNYKLQLQQVEAALTTDPNNEELIKLKFDLKEVIKLTHDLIKSQQQEKRQANGMDAKDPILLAVLANKWKVGDQCMAPWSEDNKYYEATIDAISEDGIVNVTFNEYKNTDVTMLSQLKSVAKRPASDWADQKSKKRKMQAAAVAGSDPNKQREYLKKKKQRKLQRFKELEEERELEKNKWLAFTNKSSKKGVIKKSIFATPENVNGRVGIGTCGVSGREMTKFSNGEKWRRGA